MGQTLLELQAANCKLRAANCKLQAANCKGPAASQEPTQFGPISPGHELDPCNRKQEGAPRSLVLCLSSVREGISKPFGVGRVKLEFD